MPRPLHIPGMGEIEAQSNLARDEFIGDSAVIYPVDGYEPAPSVPIMKLVADRLDGGDIDNRDTEPTARHVEIRKRLLMKGINLRESDIFGAVAANYCLAQQFPVRLFCEPTKISALRSGKIERFAVGIAQFNLVSKNRGKCLNLDQLWNEIARFGAHQRKIGCKEMRM